MGMRLKAPNGISRYSYHYSNGDIAYYSSEPVKEWEDGKFVRYRVDTVDKSVVRFYYGKTENVSWSGVEWI